MSYLVTLPQCLICKRCERTKREKCLVPIPIVCPFCLFAFSPHHRKNQNVVFVREHNAHYIIIGWNAPILETPKTQPCVCHNSVTYKLDKGHIYIASQIPIRAMHQRRLTSTIWPMIWLRHIHLLIKQNCTHAFGGNEVFPHFLLLLSTTQLVQLE